MSSEAAPSLATPEEQAGRGHKDVQAPGFAQLLYEDWLTNGKRTTAAGFQALVVYRLGVWAQQQSPLRRSVSLLLYRLLYAAVRTLYGVEIPRQARIGRRLRIPHAVGVIISGEAEIGDDCWVRQNVTIGRFDRGRKRPPPYAPRLGNHVEVGAGAVLVGGIRIGDGARVGPNAVVMTDVPAHGSAFAPPAKVMKPLDGRDAPPTTDH